MMKTKVKWWFECGIEGRSEELDIMELKPSQMDEDFIDENMESIMLFGIENEEFIPIPNFEPNANAILPMNWGVISIDKWSESEVEKIKRRLKKPKNDVRKRIKIKRILYITDDWDKEGWKNQRRWLSERESSTKNLYSFSIRKSLRKAIPILNKKEFDAVIIDLGLIGDDWNIVNLFWNKYPIIFGGVLGSRHAESEVKKNLPDIGEIDTIDFGVSETIYGLDGYFKNIEGENNE